MAVQATVLTTGIFQKKRIGPEIDLGRCLSSMSGDEAYTNERITMMNNSSNSTTSNVSHSNAEELGRGVGICASIAALLCGLAYLVSNGK